MSSERERERVRERERERERERVRCLLSFVISLLLCFIRRCSCSDYCASFIIHILNHSERERERDRERERERERVVCMFFQYNCASFNAVHMCNYSEIERERERVICIFITLIKLKCIHV